MTKATPDPNRAKRDPKGRYLPGTAPGPGNPHAAHVHALKQAIYKAITPAALLPVLKKMLALATAGDIAAARLILEYAIGKPRVEPEAPARLGLPAANDAASIVQATAHLVAALDHGEISGEAAGRLAGLLEAGRKAIETGELEARLNELEALVKGGDVCDESTAWKN
jgi:hypothetical protein